MHTADYDAPPPAVFITNENYEETLCQIENGNKMVEGKRINLHERKRIDRRGVGAENYS
jgi:hypothetical protein